jgi:hypothetical protein
MVYRKVSRDDKVVAVLAVMRGAAPSSVARKCGVSRGTLYKLMARARVLIQRSLAHPNDGGSRENARLGDRLRAVTKEADAVQRKLRLCEARLREANKAVKILQNLGRPIRCRACGCEKIYRNGSYRISHSHFCKRFEKQKGKRIEVRHYICAACSENMYVVDPRRNIFRIDAPHGEGRGVVRHFAIKGTPARGARAGGARVPHHDMGQKDIAKSTRLRLAPADDQGAWSSGIAAD